MQVFHPYTHPRPLGWPQVKNSTLLEYGQVAYQIKGNDTCSNLVANILPADTPSTPGMGVKRSKHFFSENSPVAYQIKGNGAQSTMKANILSLHTPLTPGVGSKGHFSFSF